MGLFAPLDRQSVIGISVDPTNSGQVFAAMGSGVLACFSGRSMKRQVQAHKGPCMAVKATQDGVYSVGKDGMAIKWDKNLGSKITSWKNPGDHGLRSISVKEDIGTIVIGTEESVAVKLDMNLQGANTLFEAHFDDELWGLSMHPTDCNLAATVSRDRSIRIWDLAGHKQVKRLDLPFQKRVRNASASGGGADVCAWSGDGAYLACGLLCGDVVIFKTSDWTQHSKVSLPTNSKTPQISDIKFCPDWENNAQMAVGSHDNMVYLFNDLGEEDLNMKPTRDECVKCRAHSSYITHLDYNKEGSMIHTNCGAYELLFFNTETGKQEGYGASNTKDDDWASWTAVLGWPVQGIFPPFSDGTDVNACHKAHNSDLLATSDDFGRVNLYNWPCLNRHWTGKKWEGEMNGAVQLEGHSSHVTNVRFSLDDSKLLSCGGNDKSVFQWVQDN